MKFNELQESSRCFHITFTDDNCEGSMVRFKNDSSLWLASIWPNNYVDGQAHNLDWPLSFEHEDYLEVKRWVVKIVSELPDLARKSMEEE